MSGARAAEAFHPNREERSTAIGRRGFLALDFAAGARAPEGDRCVGPADRLRQGYGGGHYVRVYRHAMACRFEVVLSDEDARHVSAARRALGEAERLEAALTVFRDTSDLVRVNRTAADGPVAIDDRLFDLLRLCADLHARTRGAFDITSTPLSRCWGFLKREGRLPPDEEIETARALVGMDGVVLDHGRQTVCFRRSGMELNLGAIGKGYALGRMGDRLWTSGIRHALIAAGGSSVLAIGGRDQGWPIDLWSRQTARKLARLHLWNGALGTSGAGEQYVDIEGTRYGHVLDPRTGWPAATVLSTSVVTADPAVADALSTAFLIGGAELAAEYCAAHAETMVLLTPDEGATRPLVFGSYRGATIEGTL